jgi:ubiquinone/menaquinone biosynthesis C-methylase UbiE
MKDSEHCMQNIDNKTVAGFGEEWQYYDQSKLDKKQHQEQFDRYFHIFPWEKLAPTAVGFDMGCGSGRWAQLAAPQVGKLVCIDASTEALAVAKQKLKKINNVEVVQGTFDAIPLKDASMDFGYCLGVLHHVPETETALQACTQKLKQNAPFLLYIYYAFDNRPVWFVLLWKATDLFRKAISRLPFGLRRFVTASIATMVYFPLAKTSWLLEKCGVPVAPIPLSHYRNHSYYTMCTDALDRFGTRLEHRFTRTEIEAMMLRSGLGNITFSNAEPFWCAVGYKL